VAFVAVCCLPRANTRRNVCRGLLLFRRVSQAHGIGMISGSAPTVSGTCGGFSQKQDMIVVCDQQCTVLTSCVTYLSGLQEV
jgi:hypothetical protein